LGNSINNFDFLFFSPLIIALIISLIAIFVYITALLRKKEKNKSNKIVKLLLMISSFLGIGVLIGFVIALNNTASNNFYILAFGIPEDWSYLFTLLYVFLGLILLTCLYFLFRIKKIDNRSVLFTVLFSNILIGVYFLYWGFFSFP
jgi:nitric oxide reductase large subunit